MTLQEFYAALEKIGSLSLTTVEAGVPHSRIVSACGCDGDGVHFLTMTTKPMYRQLKADPRVALCGIYPSAQKTGKNAVGQPCFAPGYTLRLTGEAREEDLDEVRAKARAGSAIHLFIAEDQERYPAIRSFCIYKGKGEIFDFDFEKEHKDHKLDRWRIAFGGETVNEPGPHIDPHKCIACGACLNACTFDAVIEGAPYTIDGSRCDECGSCILACPEEAIRLSETM
ncbi:4Fe-4S binding protein [Desulfocurvus sp. DL9XJH121]